MNRSSKGPGRKKKKGAPGEVPGPSWAQILKLIDSWWFGGRTWLRLGPEDEGQNVTLMLKNSTGPPGGSGRGSLRVLKTRFNIEAFRDRCLVDFGSVLETAREAKKVFSLSENRIFRFSAILN